MKFWKPVLFTTLSFFAVLTTVVYTSCEKDPCDNVTCQHGGSCHTGICSCPTGYEGPSCENMSINHFIGTFSGFSGCNNGAQLIDTVFVKQYPRSVNKLKIWEKLHPMDTFVGTLSVNQSTYVIIVPQKTDTNYQKIYNITVQDDKKLVLHTYERDLRIPGDTSINDCTFTGFKDAN